MILQIIKLYQGFVSFVTRISWQILTKSKEGVEAQKPAQGFAITSVCSRYLTQSSRIRLHTIQSTSGYTNKQEKRPDANCVVSRKPQLTTGATNQVNTSKIWTTGGSSALSATMPMTKSGERPGTLGRSDMLMASNPSIPF